LPIDDQKLIRRALAKGSALIETTDEVFGDVKTRLRDYDKSTDALLARAGKIYKSLTGDSYSPSTPLGQIMSDTYREMLKPLSPDELDRWSMTRPSLGDDIKKRRNQSVFYRDPVVILLAWLATHNEMGFPKHWPIDGKYLEELYNMLGLSTQELC
jgi:hypothetical protein